MKCCLCKEGPKYLYRDVCYILQGMTRLFLTKIPFFREVIVSSFTCDHCGNKNAELQPAGRIQDKGVRYEVNVTSVKVGCF